MQLNEFVCPRAVNAGGFHSVWGVLPSSCTVNPSISSFLVDRTYGPASPGRADVDLPAADGATSGFCRQRLGRGTRGLAGLAGAAGLGWAALFTPTHRGQGRGHWQGNVWSHPTQLTPYSKDYYYGTIDLRTTALRSVLWRHPSLRAVPRYCPICNVFVAGCQVVSALSDPSRPLTGEIFVTVFSSQPTPFRSTAFSSNSQFQCFPRHCTLLSVTPIRLQDGSDGISSLCCSLSLRPPENLRSCELRAFVDVPEASIPAPFRGCRSLSLQIPSH